MRRKRVLVVLTLLVAACAGVALWTARAERRHGPFWDHYQQVQLDMTEEEVVEILGPPHGAIDLGGSLGPRCCRWDAGQKSIWVVFSPVDMDGPWRATEKLFFPQTIWEQLEDKSSQNGYDLRRWIADWP
jgi:hypothetical protein